MKEKVDQRRKEKEKLARLTQTSENYQKNAIVIRSRAAAGLCGNIKTRQESLEELAALGIDLEAACYRVAVLIWICIRTAVSLLRRNARRVH